MGTKGFFTIAKLSVHTLLTLSFTTQAFATGTNCPPPLRTGGINNLVSPDLIHNINVVKEGGRDPRIQVARTGDFQWLEPVGGLFSNQAVSLPDDPRTRGIVDGSAFRVSPCFILTAYHAVFGGSRSPNRTSFTNTFVSLSADKQSYVQNRVTPYAWGPFDQTGQRKDDWALVKLDDDKCVYDNNWLALEAMPISQMENKEVTIAGYPDDQPRNAVTIHANCLTKKYDHVFAPGAILHGCASRPGNSGGPVVWKKPDGRRVVVGIHQGSVREVAGLLEEYDDSTAGVAVDIRKVLESSAGRAIAEDLAKARRRQNGIQEATL